MIYKSAADAEIFSANETKTFDYNIMDKDINFCVVEVNGRTPAGGGFCLNKKCKEMLYCIKGTGKVVFEKTTHQLRKGDVVLIFPNEKYYLEGKMTLAVPCSPAWTEEQHVQIP